MLGIRAVELDMGVSQKVGAVLGSPYNQTCSLLESFLGPLVFESYHISGLSHALEAGDVCTISSKTSYKPQQAIRGF